MSPEAPEAHVPTAGRQGIALSVAAIAIASSCARPRDDLVAAPVPSAPEPKPVRLEAPVAWGGASVQGLQLGITVETGECGPAGPVWTVVYRNVSKRPLTIRRADVVRCGVYFQWWGVRSFREDLGHPFTPELAGRTRIVLRPGERHAVRLDGPDRLPSRLWMVCDAWIHWKRGREEDAPPMVLPSGKLSVLRARGRWTVCDPPPRGAGFDLSKHLSPEEIKRELRASKEEFIRALDSDDDWTILYGVRGLGLLGPEAAEAVGKLVGLLERGKLVDNVVGTLGKIGPAAAPAVPAISGLLYHKSKDNKFRRWYVARALRGIGYADGQTLVPLMYLLVDPHDSARGEAARALGEMGPRAASALPLLEALGAEEKSEWVLESAWEAVRKIKGEGRSPSGESSPPSPRSSGK